MKRPNCVNCVVPPHILRKLLDSEDASIREAALRTLLATTGLRAERHMLAEFGFIQNIAGEKRRTIYDCAQSRVIDPSVLLRGEGDAAVGDGAANRAYDGLGTAYDFFQSVF